MPLPHRHQPGCDGDQPVGRRCHPRIIRSGLLKRATSDLNWIGNANAAQQPLCLGLFAALLESGIVSLPRRRLDNFRKITAIIEECQPGLVWHLVWRDQIFLPQSQRIMAGFPRRLVNQPFNDIGRFGTPKPPIRRGLHRIGIEKCQRAGDHRCFILSGHAANIIQHAFRAPRQISPRIGVRLNPQAGKQAISIKPQNGGAAHRPRMFVTDKRLAAIGRPKYRLLQTFGRPYNQRIFTI